MAYSAVPIVCLMRLVSQRLGYRVGRLSPDPTGFLEKTKTWPKRVSTKFIKIWPLQNRNENLDAA